MLAMFPYEVQAVNDLRAVMSEPAAGCPKRCSHIISCQRLEVYPQCKPPKKAAGLSACPDLPEDSES